MKSDKNQEYGKAYRTQKQRSTHTRLKLMQATIELFHDEGITRVSTPRIAEKARVSRAGR